jgi:hypothetical protein
MKPIIYSSGINRRTLLSALAALPATSGPFLTASAQAQTATSSDALPSWNVNVRMIQLCRGGGRQTVGLGRDSSRTCAEHEFARKANPEIKIIQAIDIVFKSMRERMGIKAQ